MIRVLHVVTSMDRGGLETMLMNYYRHIDRSKIQFDFLTHREYKAKYDEEIESLGGIIYHLPKLNPFSVKYKKALFDFLITHHYTIIHVHQDCLSSVVLKEAKKAAIPVRIAHSHSTSQEKNYLYPIKWWYRHFIKNYATKLFACSQEAGQWMFCGASFEVVKNAVETEQFVFNKKTRETKRIEFDIKENELLIGNVGNFWSPKNHCFIIDIFDSIRKIVPSRLILVGEGTTKIEIEEKVASLGIEDKCIFTGVRTDVSDLLQAMDVFLLPSLFEGLPVTIIEAQAAGLPCFISENVPNECMITDLVEQIPLSKNAEYWAERIIASAKKSRRNTHDEIVKAGYDIEDSAKRLQEYYYRASNGEQIVCLN